MKSGKIEITETDVQKAIEKFKRAGGLIKTLPPETTPRRGIASSRNDFENVEEFLTVIAAAP